MRTDNRKLVWFDDFSEPKINMEKWCFVRGMNGADLEYDNGENHVFIQDNNLVLLSDKNSSPVFLS